MSTITTIASGDLITNSRAAINTNFSNLNTDKIETSYLDTDTTLAANSDSKIASQKAVKAYVDVGGNVNASTTSKGIVEEATQAEVDAGTAAGGTSARLFVNPSTLPRVKVGTTPTEVTITNGNSAGEVTLATISVAANSLSTNNAVRFMAYFSTLGLSTGTTLTLRAKYGATTIISVVISSAGALVPAGAVKGEFEGMIVADGATNAQKGYGKAAFWTNVREVAADTAVGTTKVVGFGDGTAAIDSTAAQNLVITAQYNTTDTDNDAVFEFAVVELIK